jgi:prepilin-type processing-associated H-X9-DG protein
MTVAWTEQEYLNGIEMTGALCDYAVSNLEGTGVVQQYKPNRMADITDGTSYTLVVGEKRLNLARLGHVQLDDEVGYTVGWDQETVRSSDEAPQPDYFGEDGDDGEELFGSSHSGKMHAVFADGSVRSISYTINPTIFKYLCNKSDGQVIDNLDF